MSTRITSQVGQKMGDPGVAAVRSDLASRAQVHDLVVDFYREVVVDDLLAPLFEEVAEVDWAIHIPRLVDYWCGVLLGERRLGTNTAAAHRRLQSLEPVRAEHCDRWYGLWVRSIDTRWQGPLAQRAKDHAAAMMASMAKRVFGVAWAPPGDADQLVDT